MKTLELWWPLKHYVITQGFGGNATATYANGGLLGHPALDLVTTYNDVIRLAAEGTVYKTINFNNPNRSAYRAVMQIVELESSDDCYEITYGHCNDCLIETGHRKIGDPVASEGNTGEVYSNGVLVTEAEKQAGSTKGFHLHFQLRYCRKTRSYDPLKKYLSSPTDESKPYFDGANYYLVPNFGNGYNGCIDPTPFMNKRYAGDAQALFADLQNHINFARAELARLEELRSA